MNITTGTICAKHLIGYISKCPSCEFELNHKKDKHTYRQYKNTKKRKGVKPNDQRSGDGVT